MHHQIIQVNQLYQVQVIVGNVEKPQIVSKVGNMANGDVKNDGGIDVVFKGGKTHIRRNIISWGQE